MKYQPHIDGLRTIAVLPVLIFHLGSPLLPGGYVGVDIFFVISGFLITNILLEDIELGRYSLLEFYKKRMLRILPAVSIVLLATFVLSGLLFFDSERFETGKSMIAAAAFVSNFFFWTGAGYFSAPAETMPLLHTWSLAVEEQFYIFFPPLLFAIYKFARKFLLAIIVGLVILSLIAGIVLTAMHQPTAFYLLPPRAWEIGVGTILAILARGGRIKQVKLSSTIGLAGLALVLAPMFLLDSTSAFPGWNAIAPVLGAMLLVGWGGGGIVGWFLASKPFVEIGKISYSLYLWHWPVIVFWKAYSGEHLSAYEMVGLGLASCALGAISTYVVERPFRSREARSISAPKVTLCGGAIILGLVGVGALTISNAFTLRTLPERVERIAATVDYRKWPDYTAQFRTGSCFIRQEDRSFDVFDRTKCTTFDPDRRNILIIGDSHAAQLWGALEEAMPEANVMQATSSGCRALIGASGARRCTDLREWVFYEYLPSHNVDLVILGGRWREDEMQFVEPTLAKLREHATRVVVVGPTVQYESSFPIILARSELTGEAIDFTAVRERGRVRMNQLMRSAVSAAGHSYVDVLRTLCESAPCMRFAPDGVPMQFDQAHLTLSGSRFVVNENLRVFAGLDEPNPSEKVGEGN